MSYVEKIGYIGIPLSLWLSLKYMELRRALDLGEKHLVEAIISLYAFVFT